MDTCTPLAPGTILRTMSGTEFRLLAEHTVGGNAILYRAKQIDFKVKQAKLLGIYGETNWFAEKLFALAERLKRVYQKEMSPQNAGVMMGMVLGDKSQLDSEIKTMYQKSGLSHVLCVSGLHLSVIGLMSYLSLIHISEPTRP